MSKFKPRCRLYLQVAAPFTAKLESQLSQALSDVSPACVLICGAAEDLTPAALDGPIDRIQAAGAACLIENEIETAADLGADGVHIAADQILYAEARKVLGESANIGVGCGLVRHDAMAFAESGADYVAFGGPEGSDFEALSDTIAWWSEIFVVPSVAWDIADIAAAEHLTELGADFIAPPRTIWDSDAALDRLRDMDRAIGSIRRHA
ncbi:thiamine phosphate synthase [Methyloceanibacter methanicus]|uniref:thiamine phosphate synthase n=1 Tax=Methyloceanibacter methanicus TaxID=1774968 RepID=UPI0009F3E056|nr:thiamine phosphate synthase [Methyloceanibacter methanicus]